MYSYRTGADFQIYVYETVTKRTLWQLLNGKPIGLNYCFLHVAINMREMLFGWANVEFT